MFSRILRRLRPSVDAPKEAPRTLARPVAVPKPPQVHHLVLFKYNSCPACRRTMRAAEQLGLDLEMRDTQKDRSAALEHQEKTGRSTVPCLYIDGTPLFESADIIAWLRAYKETLSSV